MRILRVSLLSLCALCFVPAAIAQSVFPPAGGVGVSGPNPTATSAGAVTSLAITVTPLNLSVIDPANIFCYTGTTTRTPFTSYTFTTSGSSPITTVTVAFSSTANITCGVNATGGAGAAGVNGSNGATWSQGSGVPSDGSGNNNDFYFRTATSDVYQKASGTWGSPIANLKGATGNTGAAGSNGNSVLNGSGAPSSGTGNNGDFYLDTSGASYVIYGPKSGGAWGSGTTLTGGGITGLSVDADNTIKASKALTWAPPSTTTYSSGGTTTINWSLSNVTVITMATGNTTLGVPSNPHGSGPYRIIWIQDTSCRSVTYNAIFKGGGAPDCGNGQVTLQDFTWDGTSYQGATPSNPGSLWHGFTGPPVVLGDYPACGTSYDGTVGMINDSTTAVLGATVTGSGSNHIAMYCNGTNWIVVSASTIGAANIPSATITPAKMAAGTYDAQTDGATIAWAIGSVLNATATVTLGGNRTLNITGPVVNGNYMFITKQDGTGSRTLTLGTGCTWKVINGGAGAITLSTAANAYDVLTFSYDGTNCWASLGKNYN